VFRAWVAGALWRFVRVKENLFDTVITLASTLSLLVAEFGASADAVDALRSLAVLRFLRIMKVQGAGSFATPRSCCCCCCCCCCWWWWWWWWWTSNAATAQVFRGTKKLLRAIAASLPRIVDLLAFIIIIFTMFAVSQGVSWKLAVRVTESNHQSPSSLPCSRWARAFDEPHQTVWAAGACFSA